MTKRELTNWLEDQKNKTIMEMQREMQKRKDAVLEEVLSPLGFFEMAGQIEAYLKQAWDVWIQWKMTHESEAVSTSPYNYRGFEYNIKPLTHLDESLAEYMAKYDIVLDSDALKELKNEEKATTAKISQNYSRVINTVYASKNAKEAKAYVEGLGFDLSELETPPELATKVSEIDTSYLFLKQAA